ncbi:peptide ABC transporter substrate-binding protein [Thermoactinomyces sp. CICC 10523]|uniref:peptide ABC transporter substrate-binding protein n=1 Tax=Thermoactinomyces sp. CICC 10523 TaxID=2767428 RepID=UPI0018DBEBFC|nr:peptide ABC transporter substrate-binding protein [Thermoactinomyces sp. CICC 10523]MBH8597431.1 peptide ABC transporter substrate-binding protein [Thermoactinomyces sp. CICC 10523]
MKKFGLFSLLLLLVLAAGLSGCASKANGPEQKILNLNTTGEPTSLDPAKAFDEDTLEITNNLFEGLMRLDKNDQPQPALADKVDVSSDGLTYRFHLKKTKWSNGDPLTAHDFEYEWKRVLDPKTAAEPAFLLYFIEGAEAYNTGKGSVDQVGVKALDDDTLEVRLAKPTPSFLQLTAYPVYFPVDRKVVEKNPNAFADAKTYVSNGAFNLTEWKHNDHLTLEKNDQYYKKEKVKLDGLHYSIVSDNKTIYQLYQTKKLDVAAGAQMPADLLPSMLKNGTIKTMDGNGLAFFRFNTKKPPFTNAKVRKAFALAIDRRTIAEKIVGGGVKPAYGYVAPSAPNQFRKQGGDLIKDGQYDEAKKLLQEGMKEEGWSQLPTVTLLYSNSNEKYKKIAEAVQEMIHQHLNVEIQLQAEEKKVFFADQRSSNFVMQLASFLADYNDTYNYLESWQTDHSMNHTHWSNKEYDALLEQSSETSDINKRDQLLHHAEQILFDEAPITPLYFYNIAYAQQPDVTGIIRHPVGPNDYSEADKK